MMGEIQVGQVVEVIKCLRGVHKAGQQGVVDHIIIKADRRIVGVMFPDGSLNYYSGGELMIIQQFPLSSPFSDDK